VSFTENCIFIHFLFDFTSSVVVIISICTNTLIQLTKLVYPFISIVAQEPPGQANAIRFLTRAILKLSLLKQQIFSHIGRNEHYLSVRQTSTEEIHKQTEATARRPTTSSSNYPQWGHEIKIFINVEEQVYCRDHSGKSRKTKLKG
jgi:hypothetical protein